MMETMIPPQVGMRLRTMREKEKEKKEKKERKKKKRKKKKINKERRGIVSILYHTCASK